MSIHGVYRALYQSETECHAAVYGSDGEGPKFRRKCLQKIEELEKLSIEELGQLKYWYWDSDAREGKYVLIETIFNNAKIQLRSYLNAIVCGKADDGTKGITRAEKRIEVTTPANPADVDEVIGFIVSAIGRRIITIAVEPDVQNTKYKYSAPAGGMGLRNYERRSKDYEWH
jgi:hypothetical protein